MAAAKTFTTQFLIGSKFTGQKGFDQAQRELTQTQKVASAVNRGFGATIGGIGKLAGAIGVAALAYEGLAKAMDFWKEGVAASEDAVKQQEALGVAAERNAKRYKMSGSEIVKSMNAVTEKVAQVGFDTEDAAAGTTKLLESMSPKEIEAFAQSYADLTARFKGVTPGAEGFAEMSEQINTAITRGKAPWLSQLGYTDKYLKYFKKLTPAQRAIALQQIAQNKLHGEAKRAFDTTAGSVAKEAKAYEDLQQAVTASSVARQRDLADAKAEIWKSLMPIGELVGDELGKGFKTFAAWIKEHKTEILAWGKTTAETTKTLATDIYNDFWWLQGQSESFFKPIANNSIQEFRNVKLGAEAAWAGIKEIWDLAAPYFEGVINGIKNAFGPLYQWLIEPFRKAYDYVTGLFPALKTAVPATPGGAAVGTGAREEGDYVPEWEKPVSGRMEYAPGIGPIPRGKDVSRGAMPVGTATPNPATSSAAVAEERKALMEELDRNPALQQRFAAIISKEQGSASGRADVMEATVNRALSRHQTMQQALSDRFFGPQNRGEVDAALRQGLSQKVLSDFAQAKADVAAGRNRLRGMTDQGMANEIHSAERLQSEGEHYGLFGTAAEKQSAAYREGHGQAMKSSATGPTAALLAPGPTKAAAAGQVTAEDAMVQDPRRQGLNRMIKEMNIQQRTSGASGGQNIAMNAPITVNGVAPGRESLMAKKTALAMRDPTAQLLTEIKKARAQENRLGYV